MIAKPTNTSSKILDHLAHYLGVDPSDIQTDDSLVHDLHMEPSDLTDFTHILEQKGIDTAKIDLTEIDTVAELVEELDSEQI